MHLAELQSALHAALDGKPSPELHQLIGSRHLSPEDCLDIYRQLLCKARLTALRRLYPMTGLLLGPAHFEQLADLYADQLAAGAESIPFGEMLPTLIDGYRATLPEPASLPFLAELAHLEWRLHCARIARDDPEIDLEAWAQLPAEQQSQICPVASHSLSLQHCRWPVGEIWDALLHGRPWRPTLDQGGGWYCIHRYLDRLCVEAISDEQALLLNGILNGHNLHQLSCDVPSVRDQLTLMMARGWICRLQRPADNDQAL